MTVETTFKDGILTMSRHYDQPREDVFAAWIDASKTAEWWGCQDTTHVVSDIDPQVGGKYEHAMTITGVGVHPIKGRLTAYDPPSLLAYEMPGMAEGEVMQVNVEFIAGPKGTEIRLTQSMLPPEMGQIVRTGWTAAMERLARYFKGERRAA